MTARISDSDLSAWYASGYLELVFPSGSVLCASDATQSNMLHAFGAIDLTPKERSHTVEQAQVRLAVGSTPSGLLALARGPTSALVHRSLPRLIAPTRTAVAWNLSTIGHNWLSLWVGGKELCNEDVLGDDEDGIVLLSPFAGTSDEVTRLLSTVGAGLVATSETNALFLQLELMSRWTGVEIGREELESLTTEYDLLPWMPDQASVVGSVVEDNWWRQEIQDEALRAWLQSKSDVELRALARWAASRALMGTGLRDDALLQQALVDAARGASALSGDADVHARQVCLRSMGTKGRSPSRVWAKDWTPEVYRRAQQSSACLAVNAAVTFPDARAAAVSALKSATAALRPPAASGPPDLSWALHFRG